MSKHMSKHMFKRVSIHMSIHMSVRVSVSMSTCMAGQARGAAAAYDLANTERGGRQCSSRRCACYKSEAYADGLCFVDSNRCGTGVGSIPVGQSGHGFLPECSYLSLRCPITQPTITQPTITNNL